MAKQAGRVDPVAEAGRAWLDGEMPSVDYFALARRSAWPSWRDRARTWMGRRRRSSWRP